jgi:hypothetical protein
VIRSNDPRSDTWQAIAWSPWTPLEDAVSERGIIPSKQGIYRLRNRRGKRLLYIGISIRLSHRMRGLNRAIHRHDHVGHYAGGCVARSVGSAVEVSWVVRERIGKRDLMGEEVDLIAAYRKTMGSSPRCQFAGEHLVGNS